MSLASGMLCIVGVWIVLALVREGEAGEGFGDSSLVKLRDMCRALGLLASVGVGFDILSRISHCGRGREEQEAEGGI